MITMTVELTCDECGKTEIRKGSCEEILSRLPSAEWLGADVDSFCSDECTKSASSKRAAKGNHKIRIELCMCPECEAERNPVQAGES